jgi:hypothetical protein
MDAVSRAALRELERRGQSDLIQQHEEAVRRLMAERARERAEGAPNSPELA